MRTLLADCNAFSLDYRVVFYLKSTTMKKNMGTADKVVRLLIAALIAVLYFTGTVSGTLGLVLLILAVVFVVTSLVSFCPLYAIFGMNTCPAKKS